MSDGPTPEGYFQAPEPQGNTVSGQIILRDGSTATLRPAGPSDKDLLTDFLARIGSESYRLRFFADTPTEVAAARMLAPEPPESKLVLFVLTGDAEPRLLATGEYARETPQSDAAEVAFLVADTAHGKGLGTLLLERLALAAARYGITRFTALTMARNRAMLSMFAGSGFKVQRHLESGEVELAFSILPSRESVARMELRERAATVASLYPFFKPRTVAVLGLSTSPRSASQRVLKGLREGGFAGTSYLVNPNVEGAWASPAVLPEAELAILALPQHAVLRAVDACGEAGVRAVIIISAGFAESGTVGEALQAAVTQRVRGYGMRLIGPNSLGLIYVGARLNAGLAPELPQPGGVAVSSQSGALALAILEHARETGLGLGSVVSLGNKADVSSNDLLQYWEDDPEVRLIVLYLASFGNPRRFARLARRVGRQKPILVVKAAENGLSDVATDALFRQTGVVRAETFEELFEVAALLSQGPLPQGPRVGIVTNASGPAALAATTLASRGLEPQPMVDLSAFATAEDYRGALARALEHPEHDALFVVFSPVGLSRADEVGAVLGEVVGAARAEGNTKTVLCCFTGAHAPIFAGPERLPSYRFPESAARALARAYAYASWQREPLGQLPVFTGLDVRGARRTARAVRVAGGGPLSAEQVTEVLGAFGIGVAPGSAAGSAEAAVAAADTLSYPVVLKASRLVDASASSSPDSGPDLPSRLGLENATAVRRAYRQLCSPDTGVWVQKMVPAGTHLTVGMQSDPLFGPVLSFGLGGLYSEVLRDRVYRVTPLTDRDAAEMVRSVRGFPLLTGYRGHPESDLAAVQDLLLRVSRLVEEVPELVTVDLQVRAFAPGERWAGEKGARQGSKQGVVVLGARILVAPDKTLGDNSGGENHD